MTTYPRIQPVQNLTQNQPYLMIRTIIINSNIDINPILVDIIQKYTPSVHVIGVATDLEQARVLIDLEKPDLVFLDLDIDGPAAFALLDSIKKPAFKIVFTASSESYALNAFKYGAIDYLIKPFSPRDILQTIGLLKKNQYNEAIFNRLDYLIRQNHLGQNLKITIPTSEGINILSVPEIQRVEADRSYCFIYPSDGDRILVSKPLKEIERMLPGSIFFRVHSAFLINMNYVKSYKKEDGGYIILNDGSHIPIARRRKKEFFERLIQ